MTRRRPEMPYLTQTPALPQTNFRQRLDMERRKSPVPQADEITHASVLIRSDITAVVIKKEKVAYLAEHQQIKQVQARCAAGKMSRLCCEQQIAAIKARTDRRIQGLRERADKLHRTCTRRLHAKLERCLEVGGDVLAHPPRPPTFGPLWYPLKHVSHTCWHRARTVFALWRGKPASPRTSKVNGHNHVRASPPQGKQSTPTPMMSQIQENVS